MLIHLERHHTNMNISAARKRNKSLGINLQRYTVFSCLVPKKRPNCYCPIIKRTISCYKFILDKFLFYWMYCTFFLKIFHLLEDCLPGIWILLSFLDWNCCYLSKIWEWFCILSFYCTWCEPNHDLKPKVHIKRLFLAHCYTCNNDWFSLNVT